jgi:hypothetical protein
VSCLSEARILRGAKPPILAGEQRIAVDLAVEADIRDAMDSPSDATTLATLGFLETRLLRIEHQLYGPQSSNPPLDEHPVTLGVADLERRLGSLVAKLRVYGDLLKLCTLPALFFLGPRHEGVYINHLHEQFLTVRN